MIFSVALPVPVPKTFDYLPADDSVDIKTLIGSRVTVPFGFRPLTGIITSVKNHSDAPLSRLKKISTVIDAEPILGEHALALGKWLAHRTICSPGEALAALLPPGKEKAESHDHDANITMEHQMHYEESGFTLTEDQQAAVTKIHNAIYTQDPVPLPVRGGARGGAPLLASPLAGGGTEFPSKVFLLRGVSAAGKTEVYISAIKDVLNQGKTALYLAPEIGLVNELGEILKNRFGEKNVCVWHSGYSLKERQENWWKIKRGEYSMVIGARSAVLLPLPHLGLIVMDEEHDSAWAEDRKPRFHARDVVRERSRLENAVAVFGSATPTLEIYQETVEGRVTLLELNERAVMASAPRVKLIDMKGDKIRGIISPDLEKAISDRLNKKEQVILFLNRRGFYRFLKCASCDWLAKCEKCAVTLVQHKKEGLMCHYCQSKFPVPTKCPLCGHKKLVSGGTGTERVMEEIQKKFPWAHSARWDRDTTQKKGNQEKILSDFQLGALDILVGTQIVAQGFHFPKVTLVGVINADTSLFVPDFRAAERTFELIMQVAGRAGRDLVTGDVLIQTRHIEHPALRFAATLDFDSFSKEELNFRRDLYYPPFAHLATVESAEKDMEKFLAWVAELTVEEPIGILGPMPLKRKRKGKSLVQVILKIPQSIFEETLEKLNNYYLSNHSRFRFSVE